MTTKEKLKRVIEDAIIVSLPMRTVRIHDINMEKMISNIITAIEKDHKIIDLETGDIVQD